MAREGSDRERLQFTEELLEAHYQGVFRYAYRLTGCSSAAEDIVQEVYLRAFRSHDQLREPAAAKGWLLAIARNEFARWCRKGALGKSLENEPEQASMDAEPAIDRSEWVQSALDELPHDFRQVLLMYYFEELSYAEIAAQLEIPMGTVMSRLSRAKGHLKSALDRCVEPSDRSQASSNLEAE